MTEGKPVDIVGMIMDYESGDMNEEQELAFFQLLVDSGMAWRLQGHYGRTATAMIEAGLIAENK